MTGSGKDRNVSSVTAAKTPENTMISAVIYAIS